MGEDLDFQTKKYVMKSKFISILHIGLKLQLSGIKRSVFYYKKTDCFITNARNNYKRW